MYYYLLDTENISIKVLVEMLLNEKIYVNTPAKLIVFFNRETSYSHNDINILFGYFEDIRIEEMNCSSKDALDTYLVACLGLHISKVDTGGFCILSNDKGYLGCMDALMKYWPHLDFAMISACRDKPIQTHQPSKGKSLRVKQHLLLAAKRCKAVSTLADKYVNEIMLAFDTSSSINTFQEERMRINLKYGLKDNVLNYIESQFKSIN